MKDKITWYKLMARRGALDKAERFNYQLLVNGDKGESELVESLIAHNFTDIWWRRNLWLDRQVECDVIIITHAKIYVLNAKYYNGDFYYRDNVAYFNDKPLQNDPLSSFQLSLGRLKKLLWENGIEASVEGRLVFMNPDYSVAFDDTASVECVPRYGVLRMLDDIRLAARQIGRRNGLNPDLVGNMLLAIESDSKYNLPIVQDIHLQRMVFGLICPKCQGCQSLQVGKQSVVCLCGNFYSSKRSVILDAIQEYGMLFHHQASFTSKDIYHFLGGLVRRKYISTVLTSHYTQVGTGSSTAFVNPHFRNPDNFEQAVR